MRTLRIEGPPLQGTDGEDSHVRRCASAVTMTVPVMVPETGRFGSLKRGYKIVNGREVRVSDDKLTRHQKTENFQHNIIADAARSALGRIGGAITSAAFSAADRRRR